MKTQKILKATQIRAFDEAGVAASVMLVGGNDYLKIDKKGFLDVPAGVNPAGFCLMVVTKESIRSVVVQRNLSQVGSEYLHEALSDLNFGKGFQAVVMRDPIQVFHKGNATWTNWGGITPNRMDIWSCDEAGVVSLFQVGISTHDDGKTWRMLGVYRWKGQLFQDNGRIVGKPEHPKYGSFDVRRVILDEPGFSALVQTAKLQKWSGTPEELNLPLPEPPKAGFAVVQWYNGEFYGMKGGGPVNLHKEDGCTAWLFADQVAGVDPDKDGIVRLYPGDIVSFQGIVQEKQAVLVDAVLVKRTLKIV